jgi:hypothetical protein
VAGTNAGTSDTGEPVNYVFPPTRRSIDARSGGERRHHARKISCSVLFATPAPAAEAISALANQST